MKKQRTEAKEKTDKQRILRVIKIVLLVLSIPLIFLGILYEIIPVPTEAFLARIGFPGGMNGYLIAMILFVSCVIIMIVISEKQNKRASDARPYGEKQNQSE